MVSDIHCVLRTHNLNMNMENHVRMIMYFKLGKLHTRPTFTWIAVSSFIRSHQQVLGNFINEWTPVRFEPSISLVKLFHFTTWVMGSRFRVCTVGILWGMEMFSMVGGIRTHLDDMLTSQYLLIDWTQHTTCPRSISVGDPFGSWYHEWEKLNREPVTQVVKWNTVTIEIMGSNPPFVHSLVRLP